MRQRNNTETWPWSLAHRCSVTEKGDFSAGLAGNRARLSGPWAALKKPGRVDSTIGPAAQAIHKSELAWLALGSCGFERSCRCSSHRRARLRSRWYSGSSTGFFLRVRSLRSRKSFAACAFGDFFGVTARLRRLPAPKSKQPMMKNATKMRFMAIPPFRFVTRQKGSSPFRPVPKTWFPARSVRDPASIGFSASATGGRSFRQAL